MNWIVVLALAVLLMNLVTTIAVFRVQGISGSQRLLQLALVWLLPVIGAVVCFAFATTQANALAATSRSGSPAAADNGVVLADMGSPHMTECGDAGCDAGGGDGGGD